uniref:Ubiquitin carboxyl-terminal hydrolase n=1 Tax=Grammatophora oceanica TaxID=210454 RepID=A0A7S1YJP4_9STRA|mmetsp:Transcript_50336/g.75230  ORF Transcript_50336/g.75230 Transcript_50336/m.75230 type:complete len:332 (+) Transcript_50336:58-1053(+)
MSGGSDDWCTIESDPGVFTELLEEVGVKNVQLEEIYSLGDDESLAALQELGPIYGFIFLFQWKNDKGGNTGQTKKPALTEDQSPPGLFFAKQVTTNACATQALLSVVMNSTSSDTLELGKVLTEMKTFTASFPPDLKGEAIGASDEIRTAHNSFAPKHAFMSEGKQYTPTGDEDVFHFVAYLPYEGKVYELDGLQAGPIEVGEIEDGDWMSVAKTALITRMESSTAIKFNLMAVIQDKRIGLRKKLEVAVDDNEAQAQLMMEEAQRKSWLQENQRRKHNYVSLCVQLLKELASKGSLRERVDDTYKAVSEKKRARLAAAAGGDDAGGGESK